MPANKGNPRLILRVSAERVVLVVEGGEVGHLADELGFYFGDGFKGAQLFLPGFDVLVVLVAEGDVLRTEGHELVADDEDADVEYEGHDDEGGGLGGFLPDFDALERYEE